MFCGIDYGVGFRAGKPAVFGGFFGEKVVGFLVVFLAVFFTQKLFSTFFQPACKYRKKRDTIEPCQARCEAGTNRRKKMDVLQAMDYIKYVAGIKPADMSKCMFRFVRSAARKASRANTGMPEIQVFLYPQAEPVGMTPAQIRFAASIIDPYLNPVAFGL